MAKVLVTFGCSWTYGVGAGYTKGMTPSQYKSMAWGPECNQYSFRTILSKNLGCINVNHSFGGSSNQAQFRRAKIFFSSSQFQDLHHTHDGVVVLWGITATSRNELWDAQTRELRSVFYNSSDWPFCKQILKYHYDHAHEVDQLCLEMHHWNAFFSSIGIQNLWFDTFNHHDYYFPNSRTFAEDYERNRGPDWPTWDEYKSGYFSVPATIRAEIDDVARWQFRNPRIANLLFDDQKPRDILSLLAIKNGLIECDTHMHQSNWFIDSNRVKHLVEKGLLNPISCHPTRDGHEQIADLLTNPVKTLLNAT